MIGIDIDVRSDREDEEADVFVKHHGTPVLSSENPSLAIGLKIEAVISLLRDIESDFGMLELELRQDNNRVICGALRKRMEKLTDNLEGEITQHAMTDWSILETFGYMWTRDYKETLFLPALRADLIQISGGKAEEWELVEEIRKMKEVNEIYERLDGEVGLNESEICKCGHNLKNDHYAEFGHLTCMKCSACCERNCSFDEVVV